MERFTLLFALGIPLVAQAWGFDAHRRLAANLQGPLPANSCLRSWVTAGQSSAFQNAATEPDRWRDTDPTEGPRHYLEIDRAQPVWSYPRSWPEAEARFGYYATKNGQVPWRVEELYGRLVADFRRSDTAAARTTLAHLSHYVTDAFSLLHNTRNANPRLSPQDGTGLHARWESDMLELKANIDAVTAKLPQYYGTLGRARPTDHIFDIVIAGNALVPTLIEADVAAGGQLPALFAATSELTARRWADALTLMGSFLGSAWVDAGSPKLPGMPDGCSTDVAQGDVVLKGYPFPVRPEGVDETPGEPSGETPPGDGQGEGLPSGQNGGESAQGGRDSATSPSGCSASNGPWTMLGLAAVMVLGRLARHRRARRQSA